MMITWSVAAANFAIVALTWLLAVPFCVIVLEFDIVVRVMLRLNVCL